METEEYNKIKAGLLQSMRRFPNCKIANCECDSKNGERIGKCMCLCHIKETEDGKVLLPHQQNEEVGK